MNQKSLNNVETEALELIKSTSKTVEEKSTKNQKQKINNESPYSAEINNAFSGYDEFNHLHSIGLKEAIVTRKSLIRDIDLDLFVTCKQKTNRELMLEGASPYASDNENDYIIIHHIGQNFDAPFAELTFSEHALFGNSKLLHDSKVESWRSNAKKENDFISERITYWKRRAAKEIEYVSVGSRKKVITTENYRQKDMLDVVKEPIERIMSVCSIEDLRYISNLANSYILTKQCGASTLEDFILNLNKNQEDSLKCPKCDSDKLTFYGYQETSNEKKQRYRCKDCGNVFSLFYNSIISGCNMSFMMWLQFIDCLYNGYSLEKTAKLCNISVQAAFENRLRLFYALKLLDRKVVLKDIVAIDETYLQASHKGNRSNQPEYIVTRRPHKRGKENHIPGTSKEQICIVCALDSNGNSVARIAGLGSPTAHKINRTLDSAIQKKKLKIVYADKSYAIKKFAEINSYPIEQHKFDRKHFVVTPENAVAITYIQKMNSYHSRLKKFIHSFNGVSGELMSGYVYLFSWKERNRGKEPMEAYKELISVMCAPNLYKSIEHITSEKIIESAYDVEESSKKSKMTIKDLKKAEKIYARWARGEIMEDIGKSYGCSRQRIHQIICEFRQRGYAYTTEHEKKKAAKAVAMQKWQDRLAESTRKSFERYYALYLESENWTGDKNEFFQSMSEKYNLSVSSIKNRISEVKRVLQLKKIFYVTDEYKHKTLQEIFEIVYKRHQELQAEQPNISKADHWELLANEFGYAVGTVQQIVSKMRNDECNWEEKKMIKIPRSQVLNRDIAVFIDFMKWTGKRKDFFEYVKKEYGIEADTTRKILQMNYMADPERYEITKRY